MRSVVGDLRRVVAKIVAGADERAQRRHTDRGKLLVRDRIQQLIDPNSPFLELSQLAGFRLYGDEEVSWAFRRNRTLYFDSSNRTFPLAKPFPTDSLEI